jgi:beta-lactamase regulating signal transducer with metallopeptidase domain
MMNRDCESACDAQVIKGYTEQMRKEYAAVLIDMFQTQKRKIFLNPVLSISGSNIKKRVMNIMKFRKYSVLLIMGNIAAF